MIAYPEREPCEACNGLGTYEFWGSVYRCPVCGGRGWVEPAPDEIRDFYEEALEEGEAA